MTVNELEFSNLKTRDRYQQIPLNKRESWVTWWSRFCFFGSVLICGQTWALLSLKLAHSMHILTHRHWWIMASRFPLARFSGHPYYSTFLPCGSQLIWPKSCCLIAFQCSAQLNSQWVLYDAHIYKEVIWLLEKLEFREVKWLDQSHTVETKQNETKQKTFLAYYTCPWEITKTFKKTPEDSCSPHSCLRCRLSLW